MEGGRRPGNAVVVRQGARGPGRAHVTAREPESSMWCTANTMHTHDGAQALRRSTPHDEAPRA
jgi:hypothetical protein